MVHVNTIIGTDHTGTDDDGIGLGGGMPQVQIHFDHRDVFGNGIAVRVYGEMKIAAGERVWAKELGLKTIQVLLLTPELNLNDGLGYMAQKYVHHKGQYDNWASIDIYDDASEWQSAGVAPIDGSIWLDFMCIGE